MGVFSWVLWNPMGIDHNNGLLKAVNNVLDGSKGLYKQFGL